VAPREIGLDGREQRTERGLGDIGEHCPRLETVQRAAQQLDADLKPVFARPAPHSVEDVLKVAGAGEQLVEISCKLGPLGMGAKKPSVSTESRRAGRSASSSARRGASAITSATSANNPGLA